MPNQRYQITLRKPNGDRITEIPDFESFELGLSVNTVCSLTMKIPTYYEEFIFDSFGLIQGSRLEIFRREGDHLSLVGDKVWFIEDASRPDDAETMSIVAVDATDLLNRRIVAYDAGSAEADKVGIASDLMKDIVRENLGVSAVGIGRDISSMLAVQGNDSQGVTLEKGFARRNVLNVLQELASSSTEAGDYLAFDIVRTGDYTFEFRVYHNQRGVNRRLDSLVPILLGGQYGNTVDEFVDYLHMDEVNVVYVGGQGEEAARDVQVAEDTARILRNPFNRRERFQDGRMIETSQGLLDEANAFLREGKPRRIFRGKLQDTNMIRFGIDYDWGDYLTVTFKNTTYNCRLDQIVIRTNSNGESVEGALFFEEE